jgi:hypothetical protein
MTRYAEVCSKKSTAMNQPTSFATFINRCSRYAVVAVLALMSCEDDATSVVQLPPTIGTYEPSSAMTGQKITITGTNFGTSVADVEVTFYDGEVAIVDAVTATSISVTVPDNAYVGPVKVKIKEMEVEGGEFTVMTLCTIWVGEGPMPIPCPRTKTGEGPK